MPEKKISGAQKFSLKIGEKELFVTLDNFAERSNGEVTVQYEDTVVLAVVTMSNEDTDKNFLPLSVNYEERFYAAGKISGPRYTRREGRPSDRATLISRMIDRGIRPKFPSTLNKDVQVIITCLSWDEENDPAVLGMIAASLALHLSDIPWNGPLGAIRIGKNGEYNINPTYKERIENSMDVVVSGFIDKDNDLIINMIEGSFNEESEDSVIKSFSVAEKHIQDICEFQNKIKQVAGKEKLKTTVSENEEIKNDVYVIAEKDIQKVFTEKENREEKLKKIEEEVSLIIKEKYEDSQSRNYAFSYLDEIIKKQTRKNIIEKEERFDGRKIDELRVLSCNVGLFPRTHGSSMFSRGQTKSVSIVTLGAPGEYQLMDDMETFEKKRFMHHYNFPPYSVGEARPMRPPGRREIGHGMLGEKGLFPLIPDEENFPYTIRVVSEIFTSNGSTSMASVCSLSLALMDAGVPLKGIAAGISVGLIMEDKNNYKLLTDIQGIEDHYGDMDFKVAGTEKGITAIQMDVKIEGITKKIAEESLSRAVKNYHQILEKIKSILPAPRPDLSPFAPRIVTLKINPEKIGDIIGPRGKTINKIIDETGATIDIDDLGIVSVSSDNKKSIDDAIERIKNLTREAKVGEIFQGKVVKLFTFGAVVEIFPGQEGLVHISELANKRVEKVEDEVKVGQTVSVKVINVENGKVSLSIKQAKE